MFWSGGGSNDYGAERNVSGGRKMINQGVNSGMGHRLPASTVEIAIEGMKFRTVEDMEEGRGAIVPAKKNGYTSSSSSSSNSSNSSMGGKLLKAFKRKVQSPTGSCKSSTDSEWTAIRDAAKENSGGRNNKTQAAEIVPAWRGQSTVDTLEDELLRLRRRLELREAEMQKLKSEVSTLRKATTNGSVESQPELLALSLVPHKNASKETSRLVTSSDSFRSDASQLSCLDFSLADTGKLKFEGSIKTKITTVSPAGVNGDEQTDSTRSDSTAVSTRLAVANVNSGSMQREVRSTTDGSSSAHVQKLVFIVDKHVEGTKESLDESKAESSKCGDLGKYLTSGDLKLPEIVKGDLGMPRPNRADSECFDIDINASRSPPSSSTSSAEDEDFTFPTLVPCTRSGFTDSFVLQKETSSMFRSTECPSVHEIRDREDVAEKHLKGFLSMEGNSFVEVANSKATRLSKKLALTIEIPPATADPLQMHMKSCVMQEMDKLSKAMKSVQREESLTSTKHSDRISRSTAFLPLTRSPAAAAAPQSPPHGGAHLPRRALEWQSKASTVVEHPRPVTTARNWRQNESERRSEDATPMAGTNRFHSEDLPLQRSHRTTRFVSSSLTSPQSSDRATKLAERPHEGLSPSSSCMSPTRELSLPTNSLRDESVRKAELGSGERVWQILSSALSGEHSKEEIDVEEEVRQCLQQSRLLLASDAISSRASTGVRTTIHTNAEEKQSVPRPASRETSFSVLALSRHRRSMDKNTSPRNRSEMHEQGSLEAQEVVPPRYVDHNKLDTQFGEVDINYPTVEAKEGDDLDYVFSRPSSLGVSAEASDKKYAHPSYDSGAWDSTLRSSPILSRRRTRFFTEANAPRFQQAA